MPDLAGLKISFIAGTLGQGGAERQLFYILKALSDAGAKVRLLCLTKGEFWEEPIRRLGIPIIWVGQSKSKFARLAKIVLILRNDPPDIFQSQHFYTNLYVTAAARILGLKEIGAMRNDCLSEVKANGKILGSLSLYTPKAIAANSCTAIRNAMQIGVSSSRLKLLPNVVNCDQFYPKIQPRQGRISVLAAGRLVDQKRFDVFLCILARLQQDSFAKVKGILVGDGPKRFELERQAATLGLLPDLIEFRGAEIDMAPVYRESDIFVLTSDWEGTPNVLLEAMASGLPVVATAIGGVPDIIQDGKTGYLVKPGDEDALTSALLNLITNPHLREQMGRQARKFILFNHSSQKLPVFLNELYEVTLP